MARHAILYKVSLKKIMNKHFNSHTSIIYKQVIIYTGNVTLSCQTFSKSPLVLLIVEYGKHNI